jgi:hypothetical protein
LLHGIKVQASAPADVEKDKAEAKDGKSAN